MFEESDIYKRLADVSGSLAHGPGVLPRFLSYREDECLRCSSKEECITLVTSSKLYNKESKANTLSFIQGTALPTLYEAEKIDLLPVFFYSNDQKVRRRALTILEKLLLNIEHSTETTSLLEEAEEIIYDVLKKRLSEWTFLADEDAEYIRTVIRLYMTVMAAHVKSCVQDSDHIHIKHRMGIIMRRQQLGVAEKKKDLGPLCEMLQILNKYMVCLSSKYAVIQKLEMMIIDPAGGKAPKVPKESWYLHFAAFYSVMVRFFKDPSPSQAERIGEFLKCFKTEGSTTKKALASDLITKSLALFLVQRISSGELMDEEIPRFSNTLAYYIKEFINPKNPSAFDMLLFVKERFARMAAIEYFVSSKDSPYKSYIVKSNIRMVETLLSDVDASFRTESIRSHANTIEWRICPGMFGNLKVLLNMYIPNQDAHINDIYVPDFAPGQIGPLREVQILRRLRHEHLVQVLALSVAKLPYFYVTEESVFNNLQTQLVRRSNNKDTFHPKCLLMFIHHISLAVEFIHSKNVVHNNLTAASVFLDEKSQKAKLGNFCLANYHEDPTLYLDMSVCAHIPTRWLAPECFRNRAFSRKSDMWMFACLMYEVLTHGCLPYSDDNISEAKLAKLIMDGRMKLCHEKCISSETFDIIVRCTSTDHTKRPEAAAVVTDIESVLKTGGLASGELGFSQYPDLEVRKQNSSTAVNKGIPDMTNPEGTLTREMMRMFSETYDDDEDIYENPVECEHHYEVIQRIPQEIRNSDLFRLAGESLTGIPDFVIFNDDREDVVKYNMPRGSIGRLSAILENRSFGASIDQYLECLIVTADTLAELHDKRWVHGDIHSENILIQKENSEFKMMFTNFEHMVFVTSPNGKVAAAPTDQKLRRSAPETIKDQMFSPASDVFSFGLVMWEVFDVMFGNGRKVSEIHQYLADSEIYQHFTQCKDSMVLPKLARCPVELYDILKSCWNTHRSQRPTMSDIVANLRAYLSQKHSANQGRPLPVIPDNGRQDTSKTYTGSTSETSYHDAVSSTSTETERSEYEDIDEDSKDTQHQKQRPVFENDYEEQVYSTSTNHGPMREQSPKFTGAAPHLPPRLYTDGAVLQGTELPAASTYANFSEIERAGERPSQQDQQQEQANYMQMVPLRPGRDWFKEMTRSTSKDDLFCDDGDIVE